MHQDMRLIGVFEMPRFQLQIRNDTPIMATDNDVEFQDEAEALAEAAKAASDVLKDELANGRPSVRVAVTVIEEPARVVGVIVVHGSIEREAPALAAQAL